MSDESRPVRQDSLNAQLRGFAGEAEQLLPLGTGLPDVHDRVSRRRRRRQLGTATLLSASVLSAGLWGLPRIQSDAPANQAGKTRTEFVSAASTLPSRDTDDGLPHSDLLSPAAVPWDNTYHWRSTATADGPAASLPTVGTGTHACAISRLDGTAPDAQISRTYEGSGGATARHRIAAWGHDDDARDVVEQLAESLNRYGWHQTRKAGTEHHGHSTDPVLYEYVLTAGQGTSFRVTLVQSDRRVAVLVLASQQPSDQDHTDPRTEQRLEDIAQSASPQEPLPSGPGAADGRRDALLS